MVMAAVRIFDLFLVFLNVCLVLGQLPSHDVLALVEFKKEIKHDPTGFVLDSWNDELHLNGCPSSWNGIVCDNGHVTEVVLDGLGLSVELDLSVFSNMTELAKLSLSKNSISGKLPDILANFKNLEYLDISDNLFVSSLSQDIGQLVNLKNLSLAGNSFSGSVPDSVSGLTSLLYLDMSRNSLSGSLPSSLTRLEELIYLNLSHNSFTKTIPRDFDHLTQLDVFDLHGNMFDGELDSEFLFLTTASIVDLSNNLLVSSVKDQKRFLFEISPYLKILNLSSNQLTGSLVSSGVAPPFGKLQVLDLSYNQLSGELPAFNFVYDLQVLKLAHNSFLGFIPNNLLKGGSFVLTELDLSGNNLTGSLGIITSTTLKILNLSSNMLSGELPLLTGSCSAIDLSRNLFEGNLTRMLKWGDLEVLDLSLNHLTGSIPEVTAQFLRLNHLNISSNSLSGSLPRVITLFPKLTVLDLSFNQLDGPFLTDLLNLANLKELHMQNNKLSGVFDFSPSSRVGNVQALDLSENQLEGRLPEELGSLKSLQKLNIRGNNFSGSLPTSICSLTALSLLDISRNTFDGPLPQNLSINLQIFNASYNKFSGIVPENLSKFPLSAFYPGNSELQFPKPPANNRSHMRNNAAVKIIVLLSCVVASMVILVLLVLVFRNKCESRIPSFDTSKESLSQSSSKPTSTGRQEHSSDLVISTKDITVTQKEPGSDIASPDDKIVAVSGFSSAKASHFSWSPESGDSNATENLSSLDTRSPDKLAGELYFLDDTISFISEELSRASAEVLGRSSHGTSYKATLENGLVLTVKWLREGVAKQRKDFTKEAKKFANIRHPNVVGLRGYYWGPTQHEKLILFDYISPGNLSSFLYDRPGRIGQPLTWAKRLKIAVDVARGVNYLHFERALPHGNLKVSNILLDGPDLNARVADYCLHRLMTQSGTTEQIVDSGVLGYRAPELASSRKPVPSFKADVYAFGVVLLELVTGKCAGDVVSCEDGGVDLTDWVRLRVAEGRGSECFNAALTSEMSVPSVNKGVKEVLGIALRCIRSVSERPGIKTVYEDLSSV